MAGDGGEVARLDFETNIAEIAALVERGLRDVASTFDDLGKVTNGAQVGDEIIAQFDKITNRALEMGAQVQTAIEKLNAGSINSLKDVLPNGATLGGNFTKLIDETKKALGDLTGAIDAAKRQALGGDQAVTDIARKPIQALLDQLLAAKSALDATAERLAKAGRLDEAINVRAFANPGQVTRATTAAEEFLTRPTSGFAGSTPEDVLRARYEELTGRGLPVPQSTQTLYRAEGGVVPSAVKGNFTPTPSAMAQAADDAGRYFFTSIKDAIARAEATGGHVVATQATQEEVARTAKPVDSYPGLSGGINVIDPETARASQRLTEAEIQAAIAAEAKRAAEQEAAVQAQREVSAREALVEAIESDHEASIERANQNELDYRAGDPRVSRIGKSQFFNVDDSPTGLGLRNKFGISDIGEQEQGNVGKAIDALVRAAETDEAAARKLAQLYDKASVAMQEEIAASQQKALAERAYAELLSKNPNLGSNIEQNPGYRRFGSYVQLDDVVLKETTAGLRAIEGTEEEYKARTALARVLETEARSSTIANRGPVDAFLGGAFGHGFDSSQSFNPSQAVNNLLSTAGVLARYGYEFQLIQAAISGVTNTFKEFINYQDSLIDLHATLESIGQGSADVTASFGAARDAAIDNNDAIGIATQALSTYRDEIHNTSDANAVLSETYTQVATAAALTGQNIQQAQQQLQAATQSFTDSKGNPLGASGQSRINDAVVNAVRNFGGQRADILSAVSSVGDAANQAGLSPEESANILALIQSRTGDNAGSLAAAFDKLVSKQGNSQFQDALRAAGVNQTGDLSHDIQSISAAYNKMSLAEKEAFDKAIGGARNLKDILPILRDGKELVDANTRSYAGGGAAADEFGKHLNDVKGQIQQLVTLFKDIAQEIGQTGIFTPIGVALRLILPALKTVDDLMTDFNKVFAAFPGGTLVKDLAVTAGEFILLGKAIDAVRSKIASSSTGKHTTATNTTEDDANRAAKQRAASADAELGATTKSTTASVDAETAALKAQNLVLEENTALKGAAAEPMLPFGAAGAETQAVDYSTMSAEEYAAYRAGKGGAADAVAKGASATEKAAAQMERFGGTILPVTTSRLGRLGEVAGGIGEKLGGFISKLGPLGGLFAILGANALAQSVVGHVDAVNQADDAQAVADQKSENARNVKDLRDASHNLSDAADKQRKAAGGVTGHIDDFLHHFIPFSGPTHGDEAKADDKRAKDLNAQADALQKQIDQAAAKGGLQVFQGTDKTSIQTGIQALQDAGVSAGTIINGLVQLLGGGGGGAGTVGSGQSSVVGQKVAGQLHDAIENSLAQAFVDQGSYKTTKDALPWAKSYLDHFSGIDFGKMRDQAAKIITDSINEDLPGGVGTLTEQQMEDIAHKVANLYTGGKHESKSQAEAVRKKIYESILKDLQAGTTPEGIIVDQATSDLVQQTIVGQSSTDYQQALLAQGDPMVALQKQQTDIQNAINLALMHGTTVDQTTLIAMTQNQRQMAQVLNQQQDAALSAAESLRGEQQAVLRSSDEYQKAYSDYLYAVSTGDPTQISNAVANLNQKAQAQFDAQVAEYEAAARAFVASPNADGGLTVNNGRGAQLIDQGNPVAADQGKVLADQIALRNLRIGKNEFDANGQYTTAYINALEALQADELQQSQDIVEQSIEIADANVRFSDTVGQALQKYKDDLTKAGAEHDPGKRAEDYAAAAADYLTYLQDKLSTQPLDKALAHLDPRNSTGSDLAQLTADQAAITALQQAGVAPTDEKYTEAVRKYHEDRRKVVDDQVALSNSEITESEREGGKVSQAQGALAIARNNLANTLKGTTDYYNALKAVQDAKYQLALAELDHADEVRQLSIDLTNPILVARDALTKARAQLRHDRQHGTGDIAADLLAATAAQNQVEKTVFDTNLSNIQEKERLGQISEQQYLQYLEHERTRLLAIHSRTFQQQQELNQIDEAIKGVADSLQGQFNLGDIKVPSVYEVRRSIAQASTSAQVIDASTTTNNVTFNGVDMNQVFNYISSILGPHATGSRAPARTRKA